MQCESIKRAPLTPSRLELTSSCDYQGVPGRLLYTRILLTRSLIALALGLIRTSEKIEQ